MKYGKATNQLLIIYAFLDIVLMLIYQRMKDLKWILKQRRASSLDMALVLKGIDSLIPWCNSYRRWNWTRRYEFKSWTRLIAFHIAIIPLGKV